MKGYLVLENGEIFEGERIGFNKDVCLEVVFNTSMAGYLKVFTDPSYASQGVVMTYPLIGNYGVIPEDTESKKVWVSAVFVHELAEVSSNFRRIKELNDYLIENEVPGLKGVNTRKLTKILRNSGTMRGKITSDISDIEGIIKEIKEFKPKNLVGLVSTKRPYVDGEGDIKISLLNFGCKENIVRELKKRNCTITVYPQDATIDSILESNPDGIVLSNGPGDPEDCEIGIQTVKELYKKDIPILGICLGHQLMALATGAKTAKLKYGHRGPNHPVKDLKTNKVHITSQNHGYYVEEDSIDKNKAEVSHINLNDGTVEGLRYKNKKIFTVQFHPEACPGPEDTAYIFDEFLEMIKCNNSEVIY